MSKRPAIVVFLTMDPRSNKVGGIETHVRYILRDHPQELDVILVGIDEIGDLALGVPIEFPAGDRKVTFLPVAHVGAEESGKAASRLMRSTTLRFVLGGLRHMLTLRKLIAGRSASADLPRVEFAPLAVLAGLPFVLMVHSDLEAIDKMGTLLKSYRGIKNATESIAFRLAKHIFAVNPQILTDLQTRYPFVIGKSEVMTVPVDTQLFQPSPFPSHDVFRLVYAGRLDAVKDPAMMFETIRRLGEKLEGKLEFHLISAGDPFAFPEFEAIRPITRWHGRQDAVNVARIIRGVHSAFMASHSEGLPAFLLETFSSGRAIGALHLPTFEPFVRRGVTGILTDRGASDDETADRLVEALLALQADIKQGVISPETIAATVSNYSVEVILGRLFAEHRKLRTA